MDDTDRLIVNKLQTSFPICERPYREAAAELGLSEAEIIDRLQGLLNDGTLSRFGPLYNPEMMGGALTLAALQVPEEQFEEVAEIVNGFPQVAHNYARNHALNMWFVIATETPEQVQKTLSAIEQKTGLAVYNMPKIKEFFVGLKLDA